MVGKFQSRFGVESNGRSLDGFDREVTIAERLQEAGYVTAQFGKWHLGAGPRITDHGFRHVFNQNSGRAFAANITLDGNDRPMSNLPPEMYHIDGCSRAAAAVIERYQDSPFFLYIAYRAPHVPLDAPKKYLDRFPGPMPERRRQALAMLSAVDDGVGLVTETLEKHELTRKTLIFYIGDNGAPLKIHKLDAPGGGPGWDGSLNDPLNGEKGMLTEGGMHVPFVISWPGTIPAGQVFEHPISALDVAATAAGIANLKTEAGDLDGVNLVPFFTGAKAGAPHNVLTWRWIGQSAIREGDWKLLRGGDREYLFDLKSDLEEKHNVAAANPEIAKRLRQKLETWANQLQPPGLEAGGMSPAALDYFDFYLDGKQPTRTRTKASGSKRASIAEAKGTDTAGRLWQIRGGKLTQTDDGGIRISTGKNARNSTCFLTRSRIKLAGPVATQLSAKLSQPGTVTIAWRTKKQAKFVAENRVQIEIGKADQWVNASTKIDSDETIIHVRVYFPPGESELRTLRLKPASGAAITLMK